MPEAWQFSPLQPACKGPPLPERYLGRTLGKYSITRLLGAGAFAWVYEAIDRDLEIPVALKILRPEYAGVPAAETRFRREATTAARLRHPNIVTIRDVGQIDGAVFVAMDLLPLSLARRLDVMPRLPETEVVRLALDVASALAIAHADGIVHRDIKPDNVLLAATGEAVVADFGLASALANDTDKAGVSQSDANKVMGTPHYFSPEQARGLAVDGRADLYALGVTCYRAATGRLPFEGDDWYTVARQHIETEPVPPRALVPELSDGFDAIILRLLAKLPDARFDSATQLADALLMLPTAPRARAVSLVPVSPAVTQASLPYIYGPPVSVTSRWRRRAAYSAVAVVAMTAVALVAIPSVGGVNWRTFMQGSGTPAGSAGTDSVRPAVHDAPPPNVDTVRRPVVSVLPRTRSTSLKAPPVPQKGHVELSAPDSADLFVNDQPVDRGRWTGEVPAGRQRFRATLDRGVAGCWSAQNDSVITVLPTGTNRIYLDVAPCSVLLLVVRPDDSDYTLTNDAGFEKKGKYAGAPVTFMLRSGVYNLLVHADRCADYKDTITVAHNASTGSDTVSRTIPLVCN